MSLAPKIIVPALALWTTEEFLKSFSESTGRADLGWRSAGPLWRSTGGGSGAKVRWEKGPAFISQLRWPEEAQMGKEMADACAMWAPAGTNETLYSRCAVFAGKLILKHAPCPGGEEA